jgi:ComEC/Rec2-related protein
MHLFAVSGLNVAMLAAIAWGLLKTMRVPRRAAIYVILPLIILYAFVTGLSASCVRATVMGSLVFGGYLLDRRPLAFNGLAASACFILAWDTNQLFFAGFQYSFLLVAVLIGFGSYLEHRIKPWGQPDPFLPQPLWRWPQRVQAACWSFLAASLSVSVTSWLGSLVFAVPYFHLFTPNSVLANIFAVPISFGILVLGVASLLAAVISPGLAIIFNNANFGLTQVLLWVVHFFAAAPGGYLYVANPSFSARPVCEFTVLDTGDGGAIHLRGGGRDWLLDCGHGFGYDHIVQPYLRAQGVNRLDGLLLTHGKAARIGGAIPALDDFHPRCLVDSPLKDRSPTRKKLHAELDARNLGKRIVQRGDTIALSPGVRLTVLYPPAGLVRSSSDDKALVLRLEAAGRRILFTSDSGYSTEQWLLENEPDLRADVLVKGQHGKDLSGTPDFLLRVQPRVIIAAAPPFSASPADYDDWAETVKKQGIELFRQERTGAVHGVITATQLEVKGFLNGQFCWPGPR